MINFFSSLYNASLVEGYILYLGSGDAPCRDFLPNFTSRLQSVFRETEHKINSNLLERHEEIHRKKGSFHLYNRAVLLLAVDFVDHCCRTVFQ